MDGRPLHLALSNLPLSLLCRPPRWVIHPVLASSHSLLDCLASSAPLSHCVVHSPMAPVLSTTGLPCVAHRQIAPHHPPPNHLSSSTAPSRCFIQRPLAPRIIHLIVAFILAVAIEHHRHHETPTPTATIEREVLVREEGGKETRVGGYVNRLRL